MKDENAGYQKTGSGQPLALEARREDGDGRRYSPSTGRNKDAVRAVFIEHMPVRGRVLEIASGTGEHGVHITEPCSQLSWTYSDIDTVSQASQRAWAQVSETQQLQGPLTVNAASEDWGAAEQAAPWDGLFCANMIHIAPFEAAAGLIAGAGRVLAPRGRLMLYGPFARDGVIAPSNARFSADLQRRDVSWGVRDLDRDVMPLASAAGLALVAVIEMPANNSSVVFEKT